MQEIRIDNLPQGKFLYFISDIHLGAPNHKDSRRREDTLLRFLNQEREKMAALFIVGDLFDFWFEYKHVIPKGFVRIQGWLANASDDGLPIYLFTGNHDMWLFDYFPSEFGIPIIRNQPIRLITPNHKILMGHGDGLGPNDSTYKILKKIFANKFCQAAFRFLHPFLGFSIAQNWSKSSRLHNDQKEGLLQKESEWLYQYCKDVEAKIHHDFYLFGHRHLPLDLEISPNSRYLNAGEWLKSNSFLTYDGNSMALNYFRA